MQFRDVFLAIMGSIISLSAMAQQPAFTGKWSNRPQMAAADENTSGILQISPSETTWNIFNNQLQLDMTVKHKADTLLLIYQKSECNKAFQSSNIRFPKAGTVWAKCYVVSGNVIGMVYVNKPFVTSVRRYAKGSYPDKQAIFPPMMYKVGK